MQKINLWFALLALLGMGLGSYYIPDNPLFWLVSGDDTTQVIRLGLALFIFAQLITEPPRHFVIRSLTGLAALFALSWGIHIAGAMNSPLFDMIIFLQAAIALGITALESPFDRPHKSGDHPKPETI